MEDNNFLHKKTKGGRKPKINKASHRYTINLTDQENARFLSLFEQSGMQRMAHFITACIFQRTIKTVKIDKAAFDYHVQLTKLHGQFRSVATNYNQIVKILYRNFSEKKASAYLFKLEKQTAELAKICAQIVKEVDNFKQRFNESEDSNT